MPTSDTVCTLLAQVVPWAGPRPPSGTHRYVFLAYQQPGQEELEVSSKIGSVVRCPMSCSLACCWEASALELLLPLPPSLPAVCHRLPTPWRQPTTPVPTLMCAPLPASMALAIPAAWRGSRHALEAACTWQFAVTQCSACTASLKDGLGGHCLTVPVTNVCTGDMYRATSAMMCTVEGSREGSWTYRRHHHFFRCAAAARQPRR